MLDVCWTYVGCVLDECWTSKPYSCLYLARSRAADLLTATLWRTLGAQTVSLPASGALPAHKPTTPCYHLARGRRPDHCPACVWRTPGPQTYPLLPSGARSAPKPLPCFCLALLQPHKNLRNTNKKRRVAPPQPSAVSVTAPDFAHARAATPTLRSSEKRDAFLGLLMSLKPQCSLVTSS